METKINQAIKSVLLIFGEKYFIDDVINKQKVIQDLDNYDKDLISKMLLNDIVKSNFTMSINDAIIFNANKLIELFETNDYWQNSYTKYSKKIGLTAKGKFIDEVTDVVLDFPYKDTVLKAGMTKEDLAKDDLRPDEPFLNEVIAKEEIDVLLDKKLLVNAKKYDVEGEHDIYEITEEDNLILKGNNLLALHSLKERYAGKVKLIYIDPPYNTGGDSFVYNDKFNHSAWLTFMKNRIEIAFQLLNEKGALVVQLDDNEQAYLKVLIDSICGRQNFISTVVIKGGSGRQDSANFAKNHEFLLVYSKNIEEFQLNQQIVTESEIKFNKIDENGKKFKTQLLRKWGNNDRRIDRPNLYFEVEINGETFFPIKPNGEEGCWRWSKDRITQAISDNQIIVGKTKDGKRELYQKIFPNKEGIKKKTYNSIIESELSDSYSGKGTRELKALFGDSVFSNPKSELELSQLLPIFTNEGDLVLDFFMGSATTQAVAMKMNRRFIGIEQMDYINTVSVLRLQKVIEGEQGGISKDVDWQGGGSFVYAELMEKNTGFLKEIIDADSMQELQVIFERMSQSPDIDFRVDLEEVKATLWEHSLEEQKKTLIKILDKNQLYFNYSEIDDAHVRELVSESDYAFNQSFYKEVNQDG